MLWLPVAFYRIKKSVTGIAAFCLLLLVDIVLLLICGYLSFSKFVVFFIYMSCLYFSSLSLCFFLDLFSRIIPIECLHALIGVLIFGSALLFPPGAYISFASLTLLVNPIVVLGGIFDYNVFRTLFYEVSPLSNYYLIIPQWWMLVIVYASISLLLLLTRILIIKVIYRKQHFIPSVKNI